jgi:hypothetical protein
MVGDAVLPGPLPRPDLGLIFTGHGLPVPVFVTKVFRLFAGSLLSHCGSNLERDFG